jgi:hypothetical protein
MTEPRGDEADIEESFFEPDAFAEKHGPVRESGRDHTGRMTLHIRWDTDRLAWLATEDGQEGIGQSTFEAVENLRASLLAARHTEPTPESDQVPSSG